MESINGMEEFLKIKHGVEEAEKDDTPYMVATDEQISVVGDANKTEVKQGDYEIWFRITADMIKDFPYKPEEVQQFGVFYKIKVIFKNKTVTPRNDVRLMNAATKLMPFFNELEDNGGVKSLSDREAGELFLDHYEEFDLAIYNLVATFLGVDDYYGEYMLPKHVFNAMLQLIAEHPELINATDAFFG